MIAIYLVVALIVAAHHANAIASEASYSQSERHIVAFKCVLAGLVWPLLAILELVYLILDYRSSQ